jgi:hypothetical protein
MSLKIFLSVKTLISLVFGLGTMFIPELLLPLYDVNLSSQGYFFARLLGATLVGLGSICWFTREEDSGRFRESIILSLFVTDTLGFIVTLMAQLQGLVNILGWSNVAIWGVLAVLLGYFRFAQKETA